MSVNSKMTAIADKIRTLLGLSSELGLDAMASNLGTAVNACDSQAELIQQIKTALEGKAAGGGSGGGGDDMVKYAKITAKPESATSFTIQNPLGGIAKIVSINRVSGTATSSRKISKCVVSWGIKYGAVYAVYTGGTVKYGIDGVTGSPNNAQFTVTDGTIKIYRYNSSATWDDSNEYEVEIWQ